MRQLLDGRYLNDLRRIRRIDDVFNEFSHGARGTQRSKHPIMDGIWLLARRRVPLFEVNEDVTERSCKATQLERLDDGRELTKLEHVGALQRLSVASSALMEDDLNMHGENPHARSERRKLEQTNERKARCIPAGRRGICW